MKINQRVFGAVVFAALTFGSQMSATEVQTTSYSAWKQTVSGISEWDFSFPGNGSYSTASGYTLNVGSYGPLNVTGPDGSGYVLNKNSNYSTTSLEGASDGVGTMSFTTPSAGLTGFLLGVGESGTAAPITLTLSDGETFTLNPPVGGNTFTGFSSTTPITSFVMSTTSGSLIELTDFFAGMTTQTAGGTMAGSPTAEVATALMIGSGLLIIGARRKVFSNITRRRA